MIKQCEKGEFLDFCDRDVFGTRIKAYYNCYGTGYDFVKFWVQIENEKVVSAISRIDGDMTISSVGENMDELKFFIGMVGFSTVQCEKNIAEKMCLKSSINGFVVEYKGNSYIPKNINLKSNFDLKEIYDIIKAENLVGVVDYLPWLSDTSFRMNRNITSVLMAEESAGCAMCLFRTSKASLLGGVATRPEHRGKGIAGSLVTQLAKAEMSNGKRVELLCKADSIVDFYKSIGFDVTNEWSIINEI